MNKIKSDLTKNLRKEIKNKRVSVFIDAGNLYHAAVKSGLKLDFARISEWFQKYAKISSINFYTAFNPDNKTQLEFLEYLKKNDYNVCQKPIKIFENLSKKGNMDIELAVDAIDFSPEYDVFVLFSGDGDFHYLIKYLEKLNKTSIILSLGGFTSYELHQDADHYFFLDRISSVWKKPKTITTKKSKEEVTSNNNDYLIFIDQINKNNDTKNNDKKDGSTKKGNKPKKKTVKKSLPVKIHID